MDTATEMQAHNTMALSIFERVVSKLRVKAALVATETGAKQYAKGKFGGPQCGRQWDFAVAAAGRFFGDEGVRKLSGEQFAVAALVYSDTVVGFRIHAEIEGRLFGAPQCGREIEFAVKASNSSLPVTNA